MYTIIAILLYTTLLSNSEDLQGSFEKGMVNIQTGPLTKTFVWKYPPNIRKNFNKYLIKIFIKDDDRYIFYMDDRVSVNYWKHRFEARDESIGYEIIVMPIDHEYKDIEDQKLTYLFRIDPIIIPELKCIDTFCYKYPNAQCQSYDAYKKLPTFKEDCANSDYLADNIWFRPMYGVEKYGIKIGRSIELRNKVLNISLQQAQNNSFITKKNWVKKDIIIINKTMIKQNNIYKFVIETFRNNEICNLEFFYITQKSDKNIGCSRIFPDNICRSNNYKEDGINEVLCKFCHMIQISHDIICYDCQIVGPNRDHLFLTKEAYNKFEDQIIRAQPFVLVMKTIGKTMLFWNAPSYFNQLSGYFVSVQIKIPTGFLLMEEFIVNKDKGNTTNFLIPNLEANHTYRVYIYPSFNFVENRTLGSFVTFNTTSYLSTDAIAKCSKIQDDKDCLTDISYLQNITIEQVNGILSKLVLKSSDDSTKQLHINYVYGLNLKYQVQSEENIFNLNDLKLSNGILEYIIKDGTDKKQLAKFYQIKERRKCKAWVSKNVCEDKSKSVIFCQFCPIANLSLRCYNCHGFNGIETINLSMLTNIY